MFCEDSFDCCIKVFVKKWIVVRSSVDVDDGVDWIGFSISSVDLKDDCRCLGDADVVKEADVEVLFVVDGNVVGVFGDVAVYWVAILVGVFGEFVVGYGDDIGWILE